MKKKTKNLTENEVKKLIEENTDGKVLDSDQKYLCDENNFDVSYEEK